MPTRNFAHTDEQIHGAFRKYLRNNGIKHTRTRRQVLDAVLEIDTHFEAEQLLCHLREHGRDIAKATVYRTLPLLVDCGILKEVRFDVKQAYYERVYGEDPHDHMVCRRCRRIIEFDAAEVVELRDRIARRHGFHVTSHRLQLTGLCADCARACPLATEPAPEEA